MLRILFSRGNDRKISYCLVATLSYIKFYLFVTGSKEVGNACWFFDKMLNFSIRAFQLFHKPLSYLLVMLSIKNKYQY